MDISDRLNRLLEGGGPIKSEIRVLIAAANAWSEGRVIRLGASVAYYALFALIPVLALAVGLASLFIDRERVVDEVQGAISQVLGGEAAETVTAALAELHVEAADDILTLVSLGVLLFSATLLFVAWKDVVDLMWGVPRIRGARGTLGRRLFGVLAVLGSGALLTVNLLAEALIGLLGDVLEGSLFDLLFAVTGSLAPLALGTVFIAMLFKHTPEPEVQWRSTWLAAIVAMALLTLGSWGYGTYVSNFGLRSASGVAGTLLLGLALVYYAAMILLYGMQIVIQKERREPA